MKYWWYGLRISTINVDTSKQQDITKTKNVLNDIEHNKRCSKMMERVIKNIGILRGTSFQISAITAIHWKQCIWMS